MHWSELLRALALVMVLEGLLPFAAPGRWRQLTATMLQQSDRMLRGVGLASMAGGLLMLQIL